MLKFKTGIYLNTNNLISCHHGRIIFIKAIFLLMKIEKPFAEDPQTAFLVVQLRWPAPRGRFGLTPNGRKRHSR